MEEQAVSVVLEAMRKGWCIVILDSESREAEINFFFFFFLKTLKTKAWGEMYISMAPDVAFTSYFPFIGEVPITHPQFFFFFYFQQIPIISTFWAFYKIGWELGCRNLSFGLATKVKRVIKLRAKRKSEN
jgi:hypothetical protein